MYELMLALRYTSPLWIFCGILLVFCYVEELGEKCLRVWEMFRSEKPQATTFRENQTRRHLAIGSEDWHN